MENIEEKLKEKEEQLFKIQQEISQIRSQYSIQKEVDKVILKNLENNILKDVVFKSHRTIDSTMMNCTYNTIYFKINENQYQIEARMSDFESFGSKVNELISERLLTEIIKIGKYKHE